jgi:hypothetical protein
MKYLLILLLLSGLALGGTISDTAYAPNTYIDTIEVCDTVWYYKVYTDTIGANIPQWSDSVFSEIKYRQSYICKQKKQVWLTEDEYDKLMELLYPSIDSIPIGNAINWDSLIQLPIWEFPETVADSVYYGDSLIAR